MDASLYTSSDDRSSKRSSRSEEELNRWQHNRAASDTALLRGRDAAQLVALQEEHRACLAELEESRREIKRLKAALVEQETCIENVRGSTAAVLKEKDSAYGQAVDALQQQWTDAIMKEQKRADSRIKENQTAADGIVGMMKEKVLGLQRELAEYRAAERERTRNLNEELESLHKENANLKQQLAGAQPADTSDVTLLLNRLRLVGVAETAAAEKELLMRQVDTLKGQVKRLSANLETQTQRSCTADASVTELLKQQKLMEGKLHSERAFISTLLGSVDQLETI